jgi:hypothetical protein
VSAERLTEAEAAAVLAGARPINDPRGAVTTRPSAFEAHRVDGGAATFEPPVDHRALLVFASLSCEGCAQLFDAASEPARFGLEGSDELVLIVRDLTDRPALEAALGGAPCLVSTDAFDAYRVTSPPFFVLLDPTYATVATEGVAWGVEAISSAVIAALGGAPVVEVARLDGTER